MNADNRLSSKGRLYIHGVIAVGSAVLVAAILELPKGPDGYYLDWLILAALTAISGSATVKLPSIPASLSVSETFVFTCVLLFGPPAGTLTVALDGLIISLWLSSNRKELHRILFNVAAPAISIWVASNVFFYLAGIDPIAYSSSSQRVSIQDFVVPLLVFTILFFSINSWMIAFAVSFETGNSPLKIWRTNFMWLSLNFFCGASVAALLAVSVDPDKVDLTYLGAVIPLLLALYLTYRTAMGRVQDAMNHLQRVNKLHLATIETLAHAVDAKDQVTHGHIRRVQQLTTEVAREIGVSDDVQLRAIEASALLHDMGKLAIPEHILNKPGKLTPAEFEKMKLHASIGAEILSSIEFPYPVVPIVRHHHENWDGTGYPDRIAGVDIPIGARILSVVDCFDALTSDRPYRPALSASEALAIVRQRRGNMYDPLVVDTFERVQTKIGMIVPNQQRITVVASDDSEQVAEEVEIAKSVMASEGLATLRLLELLSAYRNESWSQVGDLVLQRLRAAVSFDDVAVFLYDFEGDDLKTAWSSGDRVGSAMRGARLAKGTGVSGWVAANVKPMLNSPVALDVLATAATSCPFLGLTLSVPLLEADRLVGVFTLYRLNDRPFTERDADIVMRASETVTRLVKAGTQGSAGQFATAHDLDVFLRRALETCRSNDPQRVLAVFQNSSGHIPAKASHLLASVLNSYLRGEDVLFVCDSRTVVALLTSSTEGTAELATARLLDLLNQNATVRAWGLCTASVVLAPRDGTTLAHLLETADRALRRSVA
jgi:putative nucleotidyltransferase with HDIG domain